MTQAPAPSNGLPRGRHALDPDEVRAHQRARLLQAMTVEVAERGYAGTTAMGVYRRAKVSSRAFYQNFDDVQDCFLAAYDAAVDVLWSRLRRIPSVGSLSQLLDGYLAAIRDEPAIARTFLIEVYGAGPVAQARRVEVHERFVASVAELLAPGRDLNNLNTADRFAVDSLIAAITFEVTMRVLTGDLGDVAELRERLLDVAGRLCPWLTDGRVHA
jgi:AcrR family transcriptional regulator